MWRSWESDELLNSVSDHISLLPEYKDLFANSHFKGVPEACMVLIGRSE